MCVIRKLSYGKWNLDLFEFLDNDQFSSLDILFIQLGAGTIILSDEYLEKKKGDNKKIQDIIQETSCDVIHLKRTLFKNNNIETIRKLVKEEDILQVNNLEIDRSLSLYGAEAVLSHVGLIGAESGCITVNATVLESHMR